LKTISIAIPVYNEKDNIVPLCDEIVKIFGEQLSEYDYEIVLRDNCSTDGTQDLIICLCKNNPKSRLFLTRKILVQSVR
jgi:glycosyltransferase involved in cell wall biosynthesis